MARFECRGYGSFSPPERFYFGCAQTLRSMMAALCVLVLAANTSFAGFPQLASMLARDRFLPRQFANRGDRLVFSNGIVLLAVFSGLLVWAFRGDTSRLIPLYAVGVFLSFTLSQAGMVVHWWREGKSLRAMRALAGAPSNEPDDSARTTASAGPQHDLTGKLEARHLRSLPEIPRSRAEVARIEKKSHWRKSLVINASGDLRSARRIHRHKVRTRRLGCRTASPADCFDVSADSSSLFRCCAAAFH